MGLGLFRSFTDFFGSLKDLGEREANEAIENRFGNGTSDHIPAQNAAHAELAQASSLWNSTRPHTYAELTSFEQEVMGAANRFYNYALSLGTSRAARGGTEILTLAKQIVADAKQDVITGAGSTGGYIGRQVSQIPDWMLYGGLGLGALLLMRRKR